MKCSNVHTCIIHYIFPVLTGVSGKNFSWPCRTRIYKDRSATRYHDKALTCLKLFHIHIKEQPPFLVPEQSAHSLVEMSPAFVLFPRVLAVVIFRETTCNLCGPLQHKSRYFAARPKYVFVRIRIRYFLRQVTRDLPRLS